MDGQDSKRFTLLDNVDVKGMSIIIFNDMVDDSIVQRIKEKYEVAFSKNIYSEDKFFYTDLIFKINTYYLYFTRGINELSFSCRIYYPENKIEELKILIKKLFKKNETTN